MRLHRNIEGPRSGASYSHAAIERDRIVDILADTAELLSTCLSEERENDGPDEHGTAATPYR